MQKTKQRGAASAYHAAREVLPGYPVDRVFECRDEIATYLSGEKVCCLLCGKSYRQLSPHIKRVHGVDADDYRQRYGIPASYALMGTERLRAAQAYGASAENMGRLRKMRGTAYSTVSRQDKKRSRFVSMTKKEMAARVNDENRDKKKYHDFSWHIQVMETVWEYGSCRPPEGHASWSGFKKRWLRDAALKAQVKAARQAFRASVRAKLGN